MQNQMLEMLKRLQWVSTYYEDSYDEHGYCPVCRAYTDDHDGSYEATPYNDYGDYKWVGKHHPDCPLDALIKQAESVLT